jgi:hypothetical protein
MANEISQRRTQPPASIATPARKDRRWLWAALLLAVVLALALVTALALSYQAQLPGLITYPNQEHGQAAGPISYAQSPPAGGRYSSQWQNCGIYNAPIPDENAVHSLARGAVWLTYRPDLSIGDIAAIQRLARDRTYILVSPYPAQQTPIVITAWGAQLPLYDPQDNRLTIFLARYRQGAQAPEAGQPCTGGIGSPIRPSGVYQRN